MENDRYYFHLPKEPIVDKNQLLEFVSGMMVYLAEYEGNLELLMRFNNNQIESFYKDLLEEWGSNAKTVLNKSIKICYGDNGLFGISSITMNNFITDVRHRIQQHR